MKELLPITICCIVLAVLSHLYSGYDPIKCVYQRKEKLFYTIMTVCLIVFAGLRQHYNDTVTYTQTYTKLISSDIKTIADIDWLKLGENPGFTAVQILMKWMGVSTQSFVMIFTAFYIGVNLWFFKKYSCNIWLSVFLYIMFAGFGFALAAIKQCTATALCLLATDRVINKKYLGFVICVLLAAIFHPYALMYLTIPFLFFRPWSQYTLVMLIAFGLIGFGLESMLDTLLNVTDMLGENYSVNSFVGEGVNPLRLAVVAVPSILSLMSVEHIRANDEKDQYLIVNLSMLNAEIMFVGLFGTANYFARLANYFLPFQAVSIPWLLKHYEYKERKTMIVLCVLGYIVFFVYAFGINENFDAHFFRITLWKYLQSLFQGAQ